MNTPVDGHARGAGKDSPAEVLPAMHGRPANTEGVGRRLMQDSEMGRTVQTLAEEVPPAMHGQTDMAQQQCGPTDMIA